MLRKFILVGLLLLSVPAFGQEPITLNTLDFSIISQGHQYILFGSSKKRTPDIVAKERALWERLPKPTYKENSDSWKFVEISKLEAIFGPVSPHYLTMWTVYGQRPTSKEDCVGSWPNWCVKSLDALIIDHAVPVGAAIVEWGCDGSLFSLLDLGKIKRSQKRLKKSGEMDLLVIGSDSLLSSPKVTKLPLQPFDKFNSSDGLLLSFDDVSEIKILHTVDRTGGHELIFSRQKERIDRGTFFTGC